MRILHPKGYCLELFVCGSCTLKAGALCLDPEVQHFYENQGTLEQDQVEEIRNRALEQRVLQSLDKEEHLRFSGPPETAVLRLLMFKFCISDEDADKMMRNLLHRNVLYLDEDGSVLVQRKKNLEKRAVIHTGNDKEIYPNYLYV